MTRNPFTDGEPFSVALLNSMTNAHANEGVLSGLGLSPGTGNFEVDVDAGEIVLGTDRIDVAAATVTHDTSGAEDRLDLITADATGALSVTKGAPASTAGQPDAEDIPTDEVLVGVVYVRGGSDEILAGDILDDYRTLVETVFPSLIEPQGQGSGLDADHLRGRADYWHPDNQGQGSGLDADTLRGQTPADLTSPLYGDGADGVITRSSNGTESGIILAERYEIEPGVTRSAADGVVVIHATEEIVIDGTLEARNVTQGGAGGTGGEGGIGDGGQSGQPGTSGDTGEEADWIGEDGLGGSGGNGGGSSGDNGGTGSNTAGGGGGGGGGTDSGGNGGDGGTGGDAPGATATDNQLRQLRILQSQEYNTIYDLSVLAGASGGGGGGGGGGDSESNQSGTTGGDGGDGGNGGDGGGVILLAAPSITISGTVDVSGTDGQDGQDGQPGDSGNVTGDGGGGGGGGGGDGGVILVISDSPSISGTLTPAGGSAGLGGTGGSATGQPGGDGGDSTSGEDGLVAIMGG